MKKRSLYKYTFYYPKAYADLEFQRILDGINIPIDPNSDDDDEVLQCALTSTNFESDIDEIPTTLVTPAATLTAPLLPTSSNHIPLDLQSFPIREICDVCRCTYITFCIRSEQNNEY